jgi:hypothetical protein
MSELKRGDNTVILHLCMSCQKVVFHAVEDVIKKLVTENGEA